MTRFWIITQGIVLVLAGLAPAWLGADSGVRAQEQTPDNSQAFAGLNFNQLITSSVQLYTCDTFRPSIGPVNLQQWERGCRPFTWAQARSSIPAG